MAITMKMSDDAFEKIKIAKASTNKVVCNMYYDAFNLQKVRIQNANYEKKESIDFYLTFEELALLATDAASGRIFKKLEAGQKDSYTFMKGSKSSKNYDGAPESRILSIGLSTKSNGDKTVFVNMSRGKGKCTETGAITPAGEPDVKIGVPMSVDKFRSLLIIADKWVTAYIAGNVNQLVGEAQKERDAYAQKNH